MSNLLNNEILTIREMMDKLADKQMNPILSAYKRSLTRTRAEIAKLYAQYSVDGALSISKNQRYTVLKQLERQLLEQAKVLGHIDVDHTTKILTNVYNDSYYRTAYTLQSGIQNEISFKLLNPIFVKNAVFSDLKGDMFSNRIWKNKDLLLKSLSKQIEKAMIDGVDIRKLSREIQKEFEVSAYQSKRLIHTEVARVTTNAQDEIYLESGLVQEVLFDATLDGLTSDICQSLDGNTYPLRNHPQVPQHPNCRSAIVPIVADWKPTVKRDNQSKETIEYMPYDKWLKSKTG